MGHTALVWASRTIVKTIVEVPIVRRCLADRRGHRMTIQHLHLISTPAAAAEANAMITITIRLQRITRAYLMVASNSTQAKMNMSIFRHSRMNDRIVVGS